MNFVLKNSKEYSKLESALKKAQKIDEKLNEMKFKPRVLERNEIIFSEDENSLPISLPSSITTDDDNLRNDNDKTIIDYD